MSEGIAIFGIRAFIAFANAALPGNSLPAVMTIASIDSVVEEDMALFSRASLRSPIASATKAS
jgi:hypothetical protein